MQLKTYFLIALALFVTGCTSMPFRSEYASGHPVVSQVQCVPYARAQSGIQLYGDAHTWWDQAPPRYQRGHFPQPGAVLVLANTRKMTHGHLAVVKNIVNPREINVTHSNWGNDYRSRRIIYDNQRVQDVSRNNDWSMVRFWNYSENVYGFPYGAKGFIYR